MSDLLAELVELEMKQGCREERTRAVVASLEIYARDLRGNSMGKRGDLCLLPVSSWCATFALQYPRCTSTKTLHLQGRTEQQRTNCINNVGVKKTGTIYEGIASESVQNASRDFERSLGVNTSFGRIGNSCELTNKYASRGSP